MDFIRRGVWFRLYWYIGGSLRSICLSFFPIQYWVRMSFHILFLDVFLMTAVASRAVIRCHAEVRLLRNDNKVRKEQLERQNLRVRLQCSHKLLVGLIRSRISRAGMID